MKSVYLATAYSIKSNTKLGKFLIKHSSKFPLNLIYRLILSSRFRRVSRVAGKLMSKGYITFSPITHCHPIGVLGADITTLDHSFWLKQDKYWVDVCDILMIYNRYPWEESYGVKREIEWATDQGKQVIVIDDNLVVVDVLN